MSGAEIISEYKFYYIETDKYNLIFGITNESMLLLALVAPTALCNARPTVVIIINKLES